MSTTIKLKTSTVLNKAPVQADLEIGEIALNANSGSVAAYIKDNSNNIVQIAGDGAFDTPDLQAVCDEGSTTTTGITAAGDLAINTDALFVDASTKQVGVGTANPIFTTDILSGTANTNANTNNPSQLSVTGPNKSLTAGGATVFINSNSDLAADTGGSIAFTGRNTTSSTNSIVNATIKGAKENATSTNTNGYLAFAVANHSAGSLVEAMRIDSSQSLLIGPSGAPATTITAAGAITAAGTGIFGGDADNGGATGIRLASAGAIAACRTSGSTAVFSGYIQGNSTPQISISAGGSITSSGTATFGSNANWGSMVNATAPSNQHCLSVAVTSSAYRCIQALTSGGADAFSVTGAGDGTFAGSVEIGTSGSPGWIKFYGPGEGSSAGRIRNAGCILYESGAATFGATPDWASATSTGIELNPAAATNWVGIKNSSGSNSANNCFQITYGTSTNAYINNSGAAYFKSILNTNGCNPNSSAGQGTQLNPDGILISQRPSFASTGTDLIAVYHGTAKQFYVTGAGNATFTGSVTASNVSDIRFKQNIEDAHPQLADVVALGSQLKNWDWNDEAPLNDELRARRFLGLVAQEAEKVCPELTYTVTRTKKGKELTPEVVVPAVYEEEIIPAVIGEDGETIEPETTRQVPVSSEEITPATYEELDDSYKAVNHDILVMKLLGAVAELTAKVEALEAS
jgi:hypothetical protein